VPFSQFINHLPGWAYLALKRYWLHSRIYIG